MSNLSSYLMQSVPRYTSYPTAPHFEPIEAELYENWLSQCEVNKPISLYLHVPYCKKLCWYCGCNMKLAARYEPLAAYVKTLKREIELVAAKLPQKMQVSHLHWGGGTPTALNPEDLADVMALLREKFTILPQCEIAIESDPRTLSDEMIEQLGALGFNRASFGVQEFDEKVQKAINRIQPEKMVRECVEKLRFNGISAINFDLIYGLPYQTLEMIEKTVKITADIKPNRIALFGYAHVPWMAKKQRLIKQETLPGIEARLQMAELAAGLFKQKAYHAIGFDHFALADDDLTLALETKTLRRNFQGFTNDAAKTLIGFGASSIGKTPFGFVQNHVETGAWARAVESDKLPIAKGHALSCEDRMRGEMIEDLLCFGEVDIEKIFNRYEGDKITQSHWQSLFDFTHFIADEMIGVEKGKLSVLPKGEKAIRVIASQFDAYLARGNKKHSLAV